MAYTIKNSDGTVLLTLADGTVDQLATSLTLIGKNVNAYGQYYNDNLVAMLENFSSDGVEPRSPLYGQLWYNRQDGRLYVYSLDNVFKSVSSAQLSPTEPTTTNAGDLWIDTVNKLLYFTTDGRNFTLAGPPAPVTTASSRVQTDYIIDTNSNTNIVASLYSNNQLVAIASTGSFTFATSFNGMTSVQPGINLNTSIPNIRFVGTATMADSVSSITNYLTDNFLQINPTTSSQYTTKRLDILSDNGIIVGANNNISLTSTNNSSVLTSNISNAPFDIRSNSTLVPGYYTAVRINPNDLTYSKPSISLFPDLSIPTFVKINSDVTLTGSLSVAKDISISGNLTVYGTTTNVQTSNLEVKDKNIQLAYGQASPSDTFADGGGITLIGSRDHNLNWSNSLKSWQVDDNFNLVNSTSSYLIGGVSVINSTSLGLTITKAPGVTELGVLDYLTVTNISITSGAISVVPPFVGSNVDLNIHAAGTGVVDVGNARITSVSTCTSDFDAANKKYVDNLYHLVGTRGFALSLDITGMGPNENSIIAAYLGQLYPVTNPGQPYYDLPDGARARIICFTSAVTIPTTFVNVSTAKTTVDKGGVPNSQQVVTDVAGSFTVVNQSISITYVKIKEYVVTFGAWTWNNADITL
jgi:hypothetical protein